MYRYISPVLFLSFVISSSSNSVDQPRGYYCYGDGLVAKNEICRFFAAVIDAGSTGTRLHLYRYVVNSDPNGIPILVEDETFKEVKPGLSSFNDEPSQAAQSVRELIGLARSTVPHFLWERTPIALKATAGLRLLPGDMAEKIMDAVEEEIFNSGFYAVPNSVSIMSGTDEGTFSWLTLNLLMNKLYADKPTQPSKPIAGNTAAAFDLGGGSTQLTYWPTDTSVFEYFSEYERHINFFGTDINLFTHSFLGNGLVAARLNVLLGTTSEDEQEKSNLISYCMPGDFEIQEWEYALKKWSVSGSKEASYDKCYESARKFVDKSNIMKLKDLHGHLVYLFSYFFDRGLQSELVKDHHGGQATLYDFKHAAQKACAKPKDELVGKAPHWMPWHCHDLTYIYSLLHDGYGFDDSQPLFLAKKIKGMEVAWAQGLSYSLLNEYETHTSNETNQQNATFVDNVWKYLSLGSYSILSYLNLLS